MLNSVLNGDWSNCSWKKISRGGNSGQCGTCDKVVKDHKNGLQCDMCDMWFHCGCEKVSAEEYELLETGEERECSAVVL